jgi:class 3 adenylate cyclase
LQSQTAFEGEREQVTVLFADVVAFTTLAERLRPEAIHSPMDGCFAVLAREMRHYKSTINQYTGEGILTSSAGRAAARR